MKAVLEIFQFCIKGYCLWKCKFSHTMCPELGFQIASNWQYIGKITITSQLADMTSLPIFWRWRVSFVNFSYWSKFHVNIITGSRVMIICLYKGLTRYSIFGNTPVWVLPNNWRLGRVSDTKFGTNISNEMLLNTAK